MAKARWVAFRQRAADRSIGELTRDLNHLRWAIRNPELTRISTVKACIVAAGITRVELRRRYSETVGQYARRLTGAEG